MTTLPEIIWIFHRKRDHFFRFTRPRCGDPYCINHKAEGDFVVETPIKNLKMHHQCDHDWPPEAVGYFTATASLIFCFFAFIGNGLVGVLVLIDPMKTLRTPVNYFILNLAFSDMVVGCVTLPMSMYFHFVEARHLKSASNSVFLHLAFFISTTACCLSHIALSVDRYIAVRVPMTYRHNISLTRSYFVSITIWIVSGLVPLMYFKLGYVTYLIVFANGALLLTLIVLTAIYVAVQRSLYVHEKELVADRGSAPSERRVSVSLELRQKRVTRVFLTVIMVFVVCTTPAVVFIYLIYFCTSCPCLSVHVLRDLQLLFVLSTSAMNPFICTLRLPTFRMSLCKLASRVSHFWRFLTGPRQGTDSADTSDGELAPPQYARARQNGITCAVIYTGDTRLSVVGEKRPSSNSTSVLELHVL